VLQLRYAEIEIVDAKKLAALADPDANQHSSA
jgi:CRP/FNR family cyclic AMP-dependent transcriptional regulator